MAKSVNYRQAFAIKSDLEKQIKRICPNAQNKTGIYIMTREENGFKFAYVGQATKCLERLVAHLQGFDQWIDKSIKKHKLYSPQNPTGWKIGCLYFPENELDDKEQYYIRLYAQNGYQLRNVSGGGVGTKFGVNDNKDNRGFFEGVGYGIEKTKKQVRLYFDKYLDFSIKGKPNKIKERKFKEFAEFLAPNEQDNSDE
jgi:hypothetical protein